VKALALDYGSARTGVAVSDPSGTLARPLTVVERVGTVDGLVRLLAVIAAEAPEIVVVGLPLTLRGEYGEQARETEAFAGALRARVAIPIEMWDERFTTTLAQRTGGSGRADDALAAAHLLQSWLDRATA
jgi:putative Holliday junction resolvase